MTVLSPNSPVVISKAKYQFPGEDRLALQVDELLIEQHQHTAITGSSGCGKTTLLRLISGVLLPVTGSIHTFGVDTQSQDQKSLARQRVRSIGMVFQNFAILEYLSAYDNILLTAKVGGLDLREVRAHAKELAHRTGIEHVLQRYPHQLSQGERQRVAICRALVTQPQLILCDEPTGNLDPSRSMDIIDLVLEEANVLGATVIAVTHDHSVLGRFEQSIDFSDVAHLERGVE